MSPAHTPTEQETQPGHTATEPAAPAPTAAAPAPTAAAPTAPPRKARAARQVAPEAARIAVAHRVTQRLAKPLGLSSGALRLLLGITVAADAAGRFLTKAGDGRTFEPNTYYRHIEALVNAGLLRRLAYRARKPRHTEITAPGRTLAAKVDREITRAALDFVAAGRYSR